MTTIHIDTARRVVRLPFGLPVPTPQWRRPPLAWLRRPADFCLAAAMLTAALPLMAVVALAIKLGSAGPVFASWRRVVGDGSIIAVLQFRVTAQPTRLAATMCWDSETTFVGRALLSTRINSLPQLFNVLRGDMTMLRWTGERRISWPIANSSGR